MYPNPNILMLIKLFRNILCNIFPSLEKSGHGLRIRKVEFGKMCFKVAVRFFFLPFLFLTYSFPILHYSIKEVVTEDGEIDFRMRNLTFPSQFSASVRWVAVRLGANRFNLYILLRRQNQVRKPSSRNLTQWGHYCRQPTP